MISGYCRNHKVTLNSLSALSQVIGYFQKRTRVNQKFCNIFVRSSLWRVYHVTEAIQTGQWLAGVGSIVIIGGMTWTLFYSFGDLKQSKTFIVQKVNAHLVKVNGLFKKFRSGCKNFDDQAQNAGFMIVPAAVEEIPVINTRSVLIRSVGHLTVLRGWSSSRSWQMHSELSNCASR